MKRSPINDLENVYERITQAQQWITRIHNSHANYYETIVVTYTEKVRSVSGWKFTYYDDEECERLESHFNQAKFDKDLAAAQANLQRATESYNLFEQKIRQDIESDLAVVNDEHSKLNHQVNILQNNIAKNHFIHCNLFYLEQNRQKLLSEQKDINQGIPALPGKIQQLNSSNQVQQQHLNQLTNEAEPLFQATSESYSQLVNKFKTLDSVGKAVLAYKMMTQAKQEVMKILEIEGFFIEKVMEIAVMQDNKAVFDYYLQKDIAFDCSVSEKETLALCIIRSGKHHYLEKLFSSEQDLGLTCFIACSVNDLKSLSVLLEHDQKILQKVQAVEGCGFGVLQYAVAIKNVELIEFVLKHDKSCLDQKTVGYRSYFEMATIYNLTQAMIVFAREEKIDVEQELKLYITSNNTDMFGRIIDCLDLSQETLITIFKTCAAQGCLSMARLAFEKINEVKAIFIEAINNEDHKLLTTLANCDYEQKGINIQEFGLDTEDNQEQLEDLSQLEIQQINLSGDAHYTFQIESSNDN
jgi:hypothetical protein